jgi:hypothetical protein
MLYREIIAVYILRSTQNINAVCGQNVGFSNFKPGGTYSDHCHLIWTPFPFVVIVTLWSV